ncbi:hypothetical protein ACIRBZ_09050 [Streptomyces sp. NPDC094038]|uniref:hypothetical protein n=1 Tax=Streptomyces sp. NPDC094038 TaxID=3366055 RepID=UPI00382DA836
MMEYEFHFVVDGISVEDDEAAGIVSDTFDGLLSRHRGRHFLEVSESGASAIDAAHRIVVRLRKALPRLRLLRLAPDLVGVSDIAERAERSRQNVQQWVSGERRQDKQPFPDPEGISGRSPVWRWGDVNVWLAQFGSGRPGLSRPAAGSHPRALRRTDAAPGSTASLAGVGRGPCGSRGRRHRAHDVGRLNRVIALGSPTAPNPAALR